MLAKQTLMRHGPTNQVSTTQVLSKKDLLKAPTLNKLSVDNDEEMYSFQADLDEQKMMS